MYGGTRIPAWQRDVIWVAGGLGVLAALVAAAALGWSRASDAVSGPLVLTEVLRVTLVPDDPTAEVGALMVRSDDAIEPGAPLEVLPGAGVTVDPTELDGFTTEAALGRVAGVWSERLLDDGREALLNDVDESTLTGQIRRTVDGPATDLVEGELAEELLPSGLADGSRMANWPLQAQRAPGEPVQPIVGIFVTVDPDELEGLTPGQIGEVVIRRLAELTVLQGADAARESISNVNLAARYEQGLAQARSATHTLFEAMLAGRVAEIADRLERARAVEADPSEADPGLAGLLDGVDVAGLPPEAANERVLTALAEATWTDGVARTRAALADDPRAERLAAAEPVLSRFTRSAYRRAVRLAWSAGVLAFLALALVAVLAQGAGRLARPGAALLLAAVPGSALGWLTLRAADRAADAGPPAGVRIEGAFGEAGGLASYLVATLPFDLFRDAFAVHVGLTILGAALVLIAFLAWAVGSFRPRRRSYL